MRHRLILGFAALTLTVVAGIGIFIVSRSSGSGEAGTEVDAVNARLTQKGLPTLSSSIDLDPPTPMPHPPLTATPGPSPTPVVPSCEAASLSGAAEIVSQYGSASSGRCLGSANFLYFFVPRSSQSAGGVAVFECRTQCDPSARGSQTGSWSFFPAPNEGYTRLGPYIDPDILILLPGEPCFHLTTGEYDLQRPCFAEPTIPPGPPWPVTPYVEPTLSDVTVTP